LAVARSPLFSSPELPARLSFSRGVAGFRLSRSVRKPEQMTIADITRTTVATAAPHTRVADVAAAMRDRDDDLVAVLDEETPLGLVSAADLGRAYVAGEDLDDRPVAELLPATTLTVPTSTDLSTFVARLADEDVRRAVVVDDDGGFVGVATFEAALAAYARDLGYVLDLLE
jgi:CBS domain-containing protein